MNEFASSNDPAIIAPEASNRDTAHQTHGWQQNKWLIWVELLVVILIFVADSLHWIPFSKTPFLLAFAWLSLRLRKLHWRDVGFSYSVETC